MRGSACQSSSKQDSNDHTLTGHLVYRTQRSQSPGDCFRVTSAARCRLQEVENVLCKGTLARNTERMLLRPWNTFGLVVPRLPLFRRITCDRVIIPGSQRAFGTVVEHDITFIIYQKSPSLISHPSLTLSVEAKNTGHTNLDYTERLPLQHGGQPTGLLIQAICCDEEHVATTKGAEEHTWWEVSPAYQCVSAVCCTNTSTNSQATGHATPSISVHPYPEIPMPIRKQQFPSTALQAA
jgi:hypothetical protein